MLSAPVMLTVPARGRQQEDPAGWTTGQPVVGLDWLGASLSPCEQDSPLSLLDAA